MKNIAIIGVGALGRRHLQSMVELSNEYNIFAVEPVVSTVEMLKEEFEHKANFVFSINDLPKELEAVVISTSSNSRYGVFSKLVTHSIVKNIVFEKVLFQKIEDYKSVEKILIEKNISSWVNCARREWPSYQKLHDYLKDAKEISYNCAGGEWGLGCNAVHMIDLMEYLSGDVDFKIINSNLTVPIVESKRKGFIEFYGSISGFGNNCKAFQISCQHESDAPTIISITSDKANIIIDEGKQKLFIAEKANEWEWKSDQFPIKYQSQLTAGVIKNIIETGTCNLPDYNISMNAHIKYLTVVMDFLKHQGFYDRSGIDSSVCPIT